MRFIALILVLISPSLATASEKIYEDLLYNIRAFHCNVEEETSPYIFIFTDGGWTLPLYEMLDPKGESTVYDINEKSDDKFSATITTDGNVIQIYFNLKDDKWTRTIVVDGEATEHDCKDVRSTVALIAASILPIIEKDIYVTLEVKDLRIDALSKGQLEAMLSYAETLQAYNKLKQQLIDIVDDFSSEEAATE